MNLDWLTDSFQSDQTVSASKVTIRLLAGLGFGLAIAGIYRVTRGPQVARSSLIATLVLLTVLIAMTTVVIGDNVARAFSVVGALSIVRFRTIVEDTRDTAFVIFAVGVGLAVGAGFLVVPLIGLPVAFAAAWIFHRILDADTVRASPGLWCNVNVRVTDGFANEGVVRTALERHSRKTTLLGVGTTKTGEMIEESYEIAVSDEGALRGLAADLLAIDGVKWAEVRRR